MKVEDLIPDELFKQFKGFDKYIRRSLKSCLSGIYNEMGNDFKILVLTTTYHT